MPSVSRLSSRSNISALHCLIASLLLLGVAPSVSAQEFEKPVADIVGLGTSGCLLVAWKHSTSGVHHFELIREEPPAAFIIDAARTSHMDCGLQPETAYRYQVCAFFVTTEGDSECSEWTRLVRTLPASPGPAKPKTPPTPRIVEHHSGDTWIGVKWEAGFDYSSYFLNTTEIAGPGQPANRPRTIHHDDDGTWGYQRVDGLLPGRRYVFEVQGCTKAFAGIAEDNCWGWSARYPASTTAPGVDPRTCVSGFVWRVATPDDLVCVTPEVRAQAAADNRLAASRRVGPPRFVPEQCPLTNPKSSKCWAFDIPCKQGFVWREATPNDFVCVAPATRAQAWADNAQAKARQVGNGR